MKLLVLYNVKQFIKQKNLIMKTSSGTNNGSKKQQGLRQLFENELKDIYWAEKALTKAIPKMIKNSTSKDLIKGLEDHLQQTKGHVDRCEQAFEILGKKAIAKKCEAMAGLTKEAEEIMEEAEEGMVRDAGIISAAQKVEHYEIATYGTLCAFAKTLGEDEIADLLEKTLKEEKEANDKLTKIAESSVNEKALHEEMA